VRCRPLSRREIERGEEEEVVRIINNNMLVLVNPYNEPGGAKGMKQN
jgi:hypothetical protein